MAPSPAHTEQDQQPGRAMCDLMVAGRLLPSAWCERCAAVLHGSLGCAGVVVQVEMPSLREPQWVGAAGASPAEPIWSGPRDRGIGPRVRWIADAAWARSPNRAARQSVGLGEFIRGVFDVRGDVLLVQADFAIGGLTEARLESVMATLHAVSPWLQGLAWHGVTAPRRARRRMLERVPRAGRAVVQMLADGLTEEQIAQTLGKSRHTVHDYVKGVYAALGVRNRMDLMRRWLLPVEEGTEGGASG
jgi:DNA-binding CsgD family transcriptional regulator